LASLAPDHQRVCVDGALLRRHRIASSGRYLDLAGVVTVAVVVGVFTDGRWSEDHEGAGYRRALLSGQCRDHQQHVASGRKGVAVQTPLKRRLLMPARSRWEKVPCGASLLHRS
jgi:hypothetical protein